MCQRDIKFICPRGSGGLFLIVHDKVIFRLKDVIQIFYQPSLKHFLSPIIIISI